MALIGVEKRIKEKSQKALRSKIQFVMHPVYAFIQKHLEEPEKKSKLLTDISTIEEKLFNELTELWEQAAIDKLVGYTEEEKEKRRKDEDEDEDD